jgi:phage tail sheath protein FI
LTDADYLGDAAVGSGLHALHRLDLFNLLCIPPDTPQGDTSPAVYQAALAHCVERRAMLLVDPPAAWNDATVIAHDNGAAVTALGLTGEAARNAILYFPRLLRLAPDSRQATVCVPCGAAAGVIARTDSQRGVWKAPAGSEAHLRDVSDLAVPLTDLENGLLNPIGVNALRVFPGRGKLIWGARTLRGADSMGDEYKYVPVRRLAMHIEESVSRGIAWAAFEPNDEPLWGTLRLNVGAFLQGLFREGAFQGTTPREAYFVQCDAQTTTQEDINRGRCNVVIGFAPLKPAEFVVLRIALGIAAES